MDNFDKDFDELLKNALNGDSDLDGLTVDEELIASTMKAIEEAAPMKEEIRASYDESMAGATEESNVSYALMNELNEAPVEENAVQPARGRKKPFITKGNVIAIVGAIAGLAAVIATFVFISNGTLFSSKEDTYLSSSIERNAYETSESATTATPEYKVGGYGSVTNDAVEYEADFRSIEDSEVRMTAPASDGRYYFEDEEDYPLATQKNASQLLDNVFMVYDKEYYKPILDAVNGASQGEPVVSFSMYAESEETVEASDEPAREGTAGVVVQGGIPGNGGSGGAGGMLITGTVGAEEAAADMQEEDFDINDPAQLASALAESQKKLEETKGLPSDDAKEVIDSVEIGGEMVPEFEYDPKKAPYWVDVEDASDEALGEEAALIVVYDQDTEADLDVCIQVYKDKCIIYDFAFDLVTTYEITDGEALAQSLREIVSQ